MNSPTLVLKKHEDRRLKSGHLWVFSNEIDIVKTPLKSFTVGEEVSVYSQSNVFLGMAYINPHSLISARIYSHTLHESLDLPLLQKRLANALALRTRLFTKPYYRLVFGESDYLPGLVVDRFNDILVLQINTAGMDKKTDLIVEALRLLLPQTKGILLRNDSPARTQEGLETFVRPVFGELPDEMTIEENDTKFLTPTLAGQKTGWFYDHRFNRARLKDYAKDQRVLDVFSYLGGWGVTAARFGAKEVYCLDSSPLSEIWIPKNAEQNQVADKIHVIREDAFIGMKELRQKQEIFDVVILDPPAFIKRQKDRKEGLLAYQRINELALKLLSPGGILIFGSCSQHLTQEEFIAVMHKACQHVKVDAQILEFGTQSADHPIHIAIPETSYLKMMIVRKA